VDRDFWLARWRSGQIGFHQAEIDPSLQRFWPQLRVGKGDAVFVPLCGKSLDMRFLEACGHPVIGCELAETAALAYFEEGGEQPRRELHGTSTRFTGRGTTLYCGDYFDLAGDALAEVCAVYDRAALIALPPPTRARYVEHLRSLIPAGRQLEILLLTIDYEQAAVAGPPFSVDDAEVRSLYAGGEIDRLDEQVARALPPKFAGIEVIARAYKIELAESRPGRAG
jgi:thiopurine S-methyltransferase